MNKESIRKEIQRFVGRYQERWRTETEWRTPLVGFASVEDPLFGRLKQVVSPSHSVPRDLLPSARTVVVFFIPFGGSVVRSNVGGKRASREWAQAYIETNALIRDVGLHMKLYIEGRGHEVAVTPATHNFEPSRLISDWSHRHVGFIAGLGNFGVNNMLITERGCCGRIGSLIVSLEVEPDKRAEAETCLYRHDASCMRCVERCVNEALFEDFFDRQKCYEMCLRNEAFFENLGKADVCGKCLVGLPCSRTDPVKALEARAEKAAAPGRDSADPTSPPGNV